MTFSDVVLGFTFASNTPDRILGAFSAAEVDTPEAETEARPQLPPPNVEPVEGWCPDWGTPLAPTDPLADEPWRHDWAAWLGNAMSVATPSFIRLEWLPVARWAVSCRFSFKAWPPVIVDFLQWLAPYIEPQLPYVPPGEPEPPTLVGTMNWDAERRPYLLWLADGRLELENLND